MIRHVVMWKLLDHAQGRSAKENGERLIEALCAMRQMIPQILDLAVHKNDYPTDKNMDLFLTVDLASLDDLNAYIIHPEHVKVAQMVTPVVSQRAAIDYRL